MKQLFLFLTAFSLGFLSCENDEEINDLITTVSISSNQVVTQNGVLRNGMVYDDLTWAQDPNVACWVTNSYYGGKHVFYIVDIPQGQKLTVVLTPTTDNDINLYGFVNYDGELPPIANAITCEASPSTTPFNNDDPGLPENIQFIQAINQGFTALVGVAGADNVEEGSYEISFTLEDF